MSKNTNGNCVSWQHIFVKYFTGLLNFIAHLFSKNKTVDHSFLIPGYTGLGNFILKTPFIKELRRLYPTAKIDVLCGSAFGIESVLKPNEIINDILILPKETSTISKIKFYWKLRGSYHTVFLFFDTASATHLYFGSLIAGITNRVGHRVSNRTLSKNLFLNFHTPIRKQTHEIDLNFDLLQLYAPQAQRTYAQVIATAKEYSPSIREKLDQFKIQNKKYIILQLSAANGQLTPKIWPPEHFQELINKFLYLGIPLIAAGDKSENEIVAKILEPFKDKVLNLTGKTSIGEIALLIKNAMLLICHDSGLMHMGNALETPLVAIWGPTDFEKNKPLSKYSKTLRLDQPCAPCIKVGGNWTEQDALEKCPFNYTCIRNIHPNMVYREALQLIDIQK